MILPSKLISQVHHFHIQYDRIQQADVITVWWNQWWKRKSVFKFPRLATDFDSVAETCSYVAHPSLDRLHTQLHNAMNETFEEPDPRDKMTTKKEGNVTYIDRTKT